MKIPKRFNLLRQSQVAAPVPDLGAQSRSWKMVSVPGIMASTFGRLNLKRRAHILGLLLGAVGPLALAVVADGAFFKYFRFARWPEVPVSLEDAALASSQQVYDLVRYVEQSNPYLIEDLLAALLQDGMAMTAIGASVATIAIMHFWHRNRVTNKPSTWE